MGGKKHKKKIHTKPKKIRHKHKKVKLAVLNFYNVDDAGKLQRLRLECPNAECGVGSFMADHFDRVYCGKCGLTYKKREWDWRQFGILNQIRQQGLGECCFAFAVCAEVESLYHLLTGKRGEDRIVLSPQDVYQNLINSEVEDKKGRTIPDTLDWIRENGCILDEDCPYKETYDINDEGPRKVKFRIETVIPLQFEEDIIAAVKEEGPVAAQMYWLKDMKRFRGDGIYYTPKDVSQIEQMHAVLIVGFGEYLGRKGKLTKFWIIRNSHGSNWGDRGYGKIERSLVTGAWQVRGISFEDPNGIPYYQ